MKVYLINPQDLKDVTVNIHGEMDFKIKRKYGKFNNWIDRFVNENGVVVECKYR